MRKRNKEKQKGKKGERVHRGRNEKKEKERKEEKEKGRISWRFDGRSSTVRVLKLLQATRSTCGHQKFGVSTNSIR